MANHRLVILIVIVLGVWGTIGYQLYSGFIHSPVKINSSKLNVSGPSVQNNQYNLTFEYTDPFLKPEVRKMTVPRVSEKKRTEHSEVKQGQLRIFIDWSKIEYLGVIHNASQNIPVATVRIFGNEFYVRENEKIDIFTIVKILNDSIQLSVQNELMYIKRNKKNDE